jgi:hypothetical protein
MGLFAKALLAAAAVASVGAVDISIQSTGGNQTGKFGHSYGYGFLHEVGAVGSSSIAVIDNNRTSTTLVTVASTPS